MEDDGTNLMILDYLGNGYTYTIAGHTLTAITDADFPAATKSLTYQDGYFIVNKQDTGRFYISALKDPTSWDALDYATAEAYSDQLMVVISTGRELWLLGRDSYEIWYNSGASDFPFARMSGGVFKGGCGARYSVVAYGNRIFMRGTDGSIKMSEGYQFKTISTPQVNFSLPAMDQSLAGGIYSAFCYSQEGHDFYVLNSYSTTAGTSSTWVYDITTGLWHERRSGSTNIKWRGNCGLYYPHSEKIIVGDPASGVLYALNLGTYTDYAAAGNVAITRVRAAQAVYGDRKNIFHAALEIEFEAGGSADILCQWSDDGGSTYNTGITKSTGATRTTRIIWRRLGRSRDRIYKLTTTTAAKFVLIGAWLDAEVGAA
uniref:Uncharacterized protein n=1 Tax=viral metagenome TaxID=1070528 RepID=A0A6M3KIT4_9ZZZZ